jgi:hypothetical protein
MVEVFERCLADSLVFSRDAPNRSLVETTTTRDGKGLSWAVIASGISGELAVEFFGRRANKADHATIPLQVFGGSGRQASIFLRMRPIDSSTVLGDGAFAAPYAAREGIPFVEIHEGQINIDLPHNEIGLFNLRWEVDTSRSGRPPLESWLGEWHRSIGFNPAHPPSHLHFNSSPREATADRSRDSEPTENDFRLAIGNPNPLAFLLSTAAWLRRTRPLD